MSITLFCLVKGNTSENAFSVKISRDEPISELKKVIKAENAQTFANIDAKDLKLWKVTIPGAQDDQLRNLILQDSDELLAINDIGDYWTEKPPKKRIHVLVEPPESTTTSSQEVKELLDRIASLEEALNKSEYVFDVIVSPKRTNGFKWNVDVRDATIEGLKEYIRKEYNPPSLEKEGAVLNFISGNKERYSPLNDQDFCRMLRQFVSKNNFKLMVVIETPSKAFSDWTFPKVCQLYELCESEDPSLSVFPPFTCGIKDLEGDSSQAILKHLIAELNARLKSIPISGNEASKSEYVCSYLVAGANLYEGKFELRPEKNITGPNGHGPVDFAIDLLQTAKTVGVTEVKDEDIFKGIAQNAVQLESALSNRKRKASEMEEGDVFTGKTFGIITDAKEWYFMECSYNEGKPSFKLSEPVTVVYKDEDLQDKVEKVLGHIAWLLEEAQKPDSESQSEERVIKKHRSSSNLTDSIVKS